MTVNQKSSLAVGIIGLSVGFIFIFMGIFAYSHLMNFICVMVGIFLILFNLIPTIVFAQKMLVDIKNLIMFIYTVTGIGLGIAYMFYHGIPLSIVISVYLFLHLLRLIYAKDKVLEFKSMLPFIVIGIIVLFNTLDILFMVMYIIIGGVLVALSLLVVILSFNTVVLKRGKRNNSIDAKIEVHDVEVESIE